MEIKAPKIEKVDRQSKTFSKNIKLVWKYDDKSKTFVGESDVARKKVQKP